VKLTLDWDEETVDLVMIAIAGEINDMKIIGSVYLREGTGQLRKALHDLKQAKAGDEDEDGIYPVKELLGSHEARLVKEGS